MSGRTFAIGDIHGDLDALFKLLSCFPEVGERDIAHYVATGEPFGKAGAYAIQSAAAAWIRHIEGSYSGIMGLPLYETAQLLRHARVRF